MRSCKINPEVKNKEGKFVDSRLFKDLLLHTNNDRELTEYAYKLSKNREFKYSNKSNLTYDDLNEANIDSLLKVIDINSLLGDGALARKYSKDLGVDKVYTDLDLILFKIIEFNDKNLPYVAIYEKTGIEYTIQLLPRISSTFNSSKNIKIGKEISNIIDVLFRSVGLEIDKGKNYTTLHNFNDPILINQTINDINSLDNFRKGVLKNINISSGILSFYLDSLSDNFITKRLISQYDTIDAIKQSLGDDYNLYNEKYNGDLNSLSEEAAIKDIQRKLSGENIKNKKAELLVNRWVNLLKDTFNKLSEDQLIKYRSDIRDKIKETEGTYDPNEKVNIKNESNSHLNRSKRIASKGQVLAKIISNDIKMRVHRIHVYKNKNKGKSFSKQEEEKVKLQQKHLKEKTYESAVIESLVDTAKWIKKVAEELDIMFNNENIDWTNKKQLQYIASRLREFKDFTASYAPNIQTIMRFPEMVKKEELNMSLDTAQELSDLAKNIYYTMNRVYLDYNDMSKKLILEYLRPFFKKIVVDRGRRKGEELTLEMILSSSDKDLGYISRLINSAADSGDLAVSLLDKVIKISASKKRLRTEEFIHKIREMHTTFIQNGGGDTKFMYDLDTNGIPVGYIISDRDFGKYISARREFIKSLDEKNLDEIDYLDEIKKWEKDNSSWILTNDDTWERVPNKSKYPSNALKNLTQVQRKYYDSYLSIKKEMDSYLPQDTTETYKAIQVMNSMTEAVLNTPKGAKEIIGDTVLDKFTRTSNDTDFGIKGIKDFSGNKVNSIPIFYIDNLSDMRRLSLDSSGSLAAYVEMSINYDEMGKIVDIMEVSADVLNEREVSETLGGKSMYSKIEGAGEKILGKITKKGEKTASMQRIRDMFEMNLYGQRKKDEGSFKFFGKEIDIAKSADSLINANSWAVMGYNIYAGINNVLVGKFQMFLEGIAGEYFNYKDMVVGDKNYMKDLSLYLSEAGSTMITSKLGLLSEMFDVNQNFGKDVKYQEFYKKTISRAFGKLSSVYVLTSMGEHYMSNRTMLAYINNYKMKSSNGRNVSLYDALNVIPVVSNGKKIGAKLKIKEGYTKLDGSNFTDDDIADISLKIGKINQSLHGIYNELDRSVIQRWVLGRAVSQFRKWLVPHMNRRMKGLHYDMQLDQWKEGFYRSFPRVLFNISKDLGHGELWAGQNWQNLSSNEKANFKRAIGEIGVFLFICGILTFTGGDYKDKDTWASRMMMYHLYRLKAELGMSIPSKGMYDDLMTILNKPVAATGTINTYWNVIKIWDLWNNVERGRFKGHSEYYKDIMISMPLIKQIKSVMDIKTEDYMFTPFVK